MASLCRTCGDKAEITTSLLDTSRHHLQWAMNHLDIELGGVLPTSVCVPCDDNIRQWTLFLSKLEKANSLFSTMVANNQSLLHQLTSDTSNTSVPSKPSTSLCSTRLSHQVSVNVQQLPPVDCISVNDNSSFVTPMEAIYLPVIESELDLNECEPFLEASANNHLADKQPAIQIDNPASPSVPDTERLQHPQVPRHPTSHTSNTFLEGNPSFPDRSTIQFPTSSSASLSDMNLLQCLVKKYHIKDLIIRMSRLSDQVMDSLQQIGTVDCNVVDNQMSEQRSLSIKLEPVDPCDYKKQVSENLSNTVDDDDIEVPFEAIYDPVVKCEPDLVKSKPSLDLSTAQIENHFAADTVQQDEMENAEADSDCQPDLPEHETSPESSNPDSNKDVNISASVFRCALCDFTINCKSKITSHIVNHHVTMPSHQCQECIKCYKYKGDLEKHISLVHSSKCAYKCPLCKRGFKLEKYLNAHIKNHDKTHQCDVCGKILSSQRALIQHKIKMHTKSSPLSCDMCSKLFYTEASLKAHSRAVHSNLSYKCDICDKSFKFKPYLLAHQRQVHVSVRAFSCDRCEKTFVSKSTLKRHSYGHSDLRSFKCGKCGSCFNHSSNLVRHIRTVHTNERTFKCHLYGKSFKSKKNLSPHLTPHSDVRNFKCKQCGEQFKTKGELKRHSTSHGEIRSFACAQCPKKFKSKAELVSHLRYVHSDLRPFGCDKCSFTCKSKAYLKVHQLVHNNVRKLECYPCKIKFKCRNDFSVHMKSKHSNVY